MSDFVILLEASVADAKAARRVVLDAGIDATLLRPEDCGKAG